MEYSMDSNAAIAMAAAAHTTMLGTLLAMILVAALPPERKKRRRRRMWIRPIFARRISQGDFRHLVAEMKEDKTLHKCYFRMTAEQFEKVHDAVGKLIEKQDTCMRQAISSRERLAITLRYLASGDMQSSLTFAYRVSKSSVSKIVKETCAAIWTALQPTYLPTPTKERLEQISNDFTTMWNMPNCFGAIDGKHVAMQSPADSGTKYRNYKYHFSTVLLAMCDAKYKFTYVDIGSYGSQSDGGIFKASQLGQWLESSSFPWPKGRRLPNTNADFPHYIVADAAFPLKSYLMRPYPGKGLPVDKLIFNYRLSRARRIIENTFGILAARWRIFRRPQTTKDTTVDEVVKACVCLHNFLMTESELKGSGSYCPYDLVDREGCNGELLGGKWHKITEDDTGLLSLRRVSTNYYTQVSARLRDYLKEYFNGVGAVSWQDNAVHRNLA